MKKITIIIILIVFNVLLIYSKVSSKEKINLSLKNDEMAIVILNNNLSKSILLLKNDISILYILDYHNDPNLLADAYKFSDDIDYIYMNDNYDIAFKNKKIIENSIIEDIYLAKNKITYHDYSFCINNTGICDFTYLFNNSITNIDGLKTLIYNKNVDSSLLDKIEDDWLDTYKISKDNYIIIFIKNDYEITNLIR